MTEQIPGCMEASADDATPVFYSPAYDRAGEDFDTLRKARWVAEVLVSQPVPGIRLAAPEPLSAEDLRAVHAADYVEAVQTGEPRELAESNGLAWDPGLWEAVRASNGGVVAAALHAWRTGQPAGSLSSGLHHARRHHGAGFCTFNGLALAVRTVLNAGAQRVLILDLDAHCGGGTCSLVRDWTGVIQLDLAASQVDLYHPDAGSRSSLDLIGRADAYLSTLRARLEALADIRFDVVLYNAGMDVHENCGIGGLSGITSELVAERERTVFGWARDHGVGVAFVLAGGYAGPGLTRNALVRLHRLTIKAAVTPKAG